MRSSNNFKSKNPPISSRPSSQAEHRPIRDVTFQNHARIKLINFLNESNFEPLLNGDIFKKMTSSDVKAIIEHIIRMMCPTFRLNEQPLTVDKTITKFMSTFNCKTSLTMSHISAPTLTSSFPFVLAAMDFLRRLAQAQINNKPSMMFPKIEELGISTEFIVISIIKMKKEIDKKNGSSLEEMMNELRINLQKIVGVMTDEEKGEREQRMVNIETLLEETSTLFRNISSINGNIALLKISLEDNRKLYEIKKQDNERLSQEVSYFEQRLKNNLEEKSKLCQRVTTFINSGYDDTLTQLNEQRDKLEFIKRNCRDWKMKVDAIRKELREVDMELDIMKLHAQEQLNETNHFMSEELKSKLRNFKVDDLLDYESTLRPLFHTLKKSMISEIESLTIIVSERREDCEREELEYLALKKEAEKLRNDEIKLQFTLNEEKEENRKLEVLVENKRREFEELCELIKEEEKKSVVLEKEDAELESLLETERQESKSLEEFYEVDIDLRQFIAEQRLNSVMADYRLHRGIMDLRRLRMRESDKENEELSRENCRLMNESVEHCKYNNNSE